MENKQYIVKVMSIFSNFIEIEANSEEEARQKTKELIADSKEERQIHYEFTTSPENWPVILKEDLDKLNLNSQETE